MTISSKVTRRVGDIKWSTYTKWAGAEAEDDDMTLTFVLEDIGRFGYGLEGDWFCFPKYVGLEVEKNQWLTMGDDPEELILRTTLKVVLEIPLKARNWERVRKDEQWQAALELTRPSQALCDHFRKLFQIIRQQKDWLAVTGAEQRSMPGAPKPQVHFSGV
ncbi:hypothetical protein COCSUDRAFT_63570 [Coccomyxa subellipsoidea C-169]|uniref:Uncharacterized protein n=1 Tax=Coccomyxa subellipsoidea (strain C-169) TaxID=574566 RepID=I0YXU4_COCSC|nr:hypothetical protein COCSUDRAFT_63570 [Coccomyxa subellipsoidea C-169]EIE23213.1 hypothetical protein COCSUDRAFT_63570 [Coccomyxa subellipsoidea C-169]|eukprot:XP_005647757.1 hypothetical protein COCSUDRAFT_63570 [Coccomyxa subellipsoidea C-169]